MVNNPLNKVEENIEICCSESIKNSVKNFQLSLTLVHSMIPFQHSIISIFNRFKNSEKFRSAASGQHLKIPIFHFFHEFGKIRMSSLEQHSNIPVFSICVNWGGGEGGECKYSLTPTIKNLNLKSMDEWEKQ